MSAYLETIAGWAGTIATEREAAESLIENVKNEQAWLGKLKHLVLETERVAALPMVSQRLGPETAGRLQQVVTPVKTFLMQLHALNAQPEGIRWQDYLTLIIAQHDVLPEPFIQLLRLGQSLASLQGVKPFPQTAPEQLAWIAETLSAPEIVEKARPLLGDSTVSHLQQTLALGQTIQAFPSEAGIYQQARWLQQLLSQVSGLGDTSVAVFLHAMRQALGMKMNRGNCLTWPSG